MENELDALVLQLQKREEKPRDKPPEKEDPIQLLRELVIKEFIPIFVDLAEKYSKSKIVMEMDASNLLQGGREIRFQFAKGEFRSELLGTATSEAIAFHETRYAPHLGGELTSGPMLRLRNLDGDVFRDFLCKRLTALVRMALRRR